MPDRSLTCTKKKSKGLKSNLKTVRQILRLYDGEPGFDKPDPESLVVHLRLGDVIENSNSSSLQMLTHGGDPAHNRNFRTAIKSIHELLGDAKRAGVRRIVVVGGSHLKMRTPESFDYSHCVYQAFKVAGYDTKLSLNGHPDKDFYFMANAKIIVVSSGGYSRLVGKIVKRQGGQIIGRSF